MVKRRSKTERLFDKLNITLMLLFSITILYPFMRQLTLSLSTAAESVTRGFHLYPKSLNFEAYIRILGSGTIVPAYINTLHRIIFGTSLTIFITCMLSYALSKKYFPNRVFWTGIIIFTMFFSGGLIPTYLLVRGLGLLNSRWVLILPGIVSPFNFIIIRNYFMSLPVELEESARIEGANDFYIFLLIYIPLSMPVVATVSLWVIVGHWNAWFDVLIYITDSGKQVVQTLLRRVLMEGQYLFEGIGGVELSQEELIRRPFTIENVKAAILILTTAPILLVYPFIQKYFIKGIMIGSLKG